MTESSPTADRVAKEAAEWSRSILRHWTQLNWFIRYHEQTIRKRWRKRTQKQRMHLLLQAWPKMSPTRRPDISADRQRQRSREVPCNRAAFLWPHINLETLVAETPLLVFLNVRGRHPPHSFIAADRAWAEFGVITGNIQKVILDDHDLVFSNGTEHGYRKLREHNAEDSATTQLQMSPGDGVLGLEIQERLYKFLVDSATSLLSDVPPGDYLQEGLPEPSEPPSLEAEIDLNPSETARHTPYRLPASFDIRRLLKWVKAKRAATEDHMLALREDPRYFADILCDRSEHRVELLEDVGGGHPLPQLDEENRLWNRVIFSVVSDAYAGLGNWGEIQRQLTDLMPLMEEHAVGLQPDEALPQTLEQSFCEMVWALERMSRFPLGVFKAEIHSSPPMRCFFRRKTENGVYAIGVTEQFQNDKWRQELLRVMMMLYGQPTRSVLGLPTLMDCLKHLIQSERSIRELISPHIMGIISDLFVLTECLREIFAFQPWAAKFEITMAENAETLRPNWNNTVRKWIIESDAIDLDIATLGAPTNGRFFYPADKRRTATSTAAMQQAEANLDTFWAKVDAKIGISDGRSYHGSLNRTLDWIGPPTASAQSLTRNVENQTGHLQKDLDFELYYRTKDTSENRSLHGSHPKPKTRGVAQAPCSEKPITQTATPSPRPKLTVTRRALQVFKVLFHTHYSGSSAKEVSWDSFRKAMAEVGFSQKKLGGSIWHFTHESKGSILIHEPHPQTKLHLPVARSIGLDLDWTQRPSSCSPKRI